MSIRPTEREQRTGDLYLRDPQATDRGQRDAPCHGHPDGKWGYVSAISLSLGDSSRSYLTASCPAPRGVPIVSFPLSRTLLGFSDSSDVRQVVSRTCRPR